MHKPNVKQLEAWEWAVSSPERTLIWAGSTRSKKTYGLVGAFLLFSRQFEDEQFMLVGKTIGTVNRNVLPAIKEIAAAFEWDYRHNRAEHWVKVGDNTFHIFGGDSEASQDKIQGFSSAGALIDEAPLVPKSMFDQTLLRHDKPNAKIFMTLNKTSKAHWFYKHVIERLDDYNAKFMESTLDDADMDEATRQFYERAFTGHAHARFILNEWAAAEGLVYSKYTKDSEDYEYDRCVWTVDYGVVHPTVVLDLRRIKGTRRWKQVREYVYSGDRTPDDHVKEVDTWQPKPTRIIMDPSARALKVAFQKKGYTVSNGDNKVDVGIQTLAAALAYEDIVIDPECVETCNQLDTLEWDQRAAQRGEDKPVKLNDDCPDALRYFAMAYCPQRLNLAPRAKPEGL